MFAGEKFTEEDLDKVLNGDELEVEVDKSETVDYSKELLEETYIEYTN